jgi:hypothetical protein
VRVSLQLHLMDTTREEQASQNTKFFSLRVLVISVETKSVYSESRDANFYNVNKDRVLCLAICDIFNQDLTRVVRVQHQVALPNVKPLIFPVFCPS